MDGIRHSVGPWARDRPGYWTARLLVDLGGTLLRAGDVVGTGGCALRVGTSWWNLYYRLTPAAWGHRLAAVRLVYADRPIEAHLLERVVAHP